MPSKQEKPLTPPPRIPVAEYNTPAPTVVQFTELVDRLDVAYQANAPMTRGTLYSTIQGAKPEVIAAYPLLYFLRENRIGESDRLVTWTWTTVPTSEGSYNATIDYSGKSSGFPRYVRVYTLQRELYEAVPTLNIGSPLSTIVWVTVNDGGLGYSANDTVIFHASDAGHSAAGQLVVDPNGTIIGFIITSEGFGYTVAPTIEVVSQTGAGAELAAVLQPQAAILVDQKKEEFPNDNPLRNEFVKVTRVYETLPGPFITYNTFRSDGSTVTNLKRRNIDTNIIPGGSLVGGNLTLTSSREDEDAFASDEIREVSLVPGPPVHGIHIDPKYGLVIDIVKTIVPDGTVPNPNPAPDGTYTEVKASDKWQSVQIASKFDTNSLPQDTVWFGGQYHSFPPELDAGAQVLFAEATCGCIDRFTSVLQANFHRYAGVVRARYTEQFYNGVPPDDVVITQFFPQAHVFGFAFASVCGCGSDSTARVSAIAPQYRLPLCLHDTLNFSVGISFSWHFDATVPAALPHGTFIMLPPHIERWRFGVFRRVLTEVFVP